MSLSGTIIVKKKESEVPLEFLRMAISNNQSCSGFSMIGKHKDTGEKEVLLGQSILHSPDKKLALDMVSKIQNSFKGKTLIMYFGSSPNALQPAAIPPYPLVVDKDGKPLLLAFLDGDCSSFHQKDSAYPDVYHAVEKDLRPRMQEWYSDFGGDLDKLVENLSKSTTKRGDLERLFTKKGALLLYGANDKFLFFHSREKNDYADFPWGCTSNSYGFGSAQAKKVEEATVGPASTFPRASSSDGDELLDEDDGAGGPVKTPIKSPDGGDNPAPDPVEVKPKPDNPTTDPVVEQTTGVKPGKIRMFVAAPSDWGKRTASDKKKWLSAKRCNKQNRPTNWNDPEFEGLYWDVNPEMIGKYQQSGYVQVSQGGSAPAKVPSKSEASTRGKDTAPKHIPQASVPATGKQSTATMAKHASEDDELLDDDAVAPNPVATATTSKAAPPPADTGTRLTYLMPPDQREAVDAWLKDKKYAKYTSHNGNPIDDPRSLLWDDVRIEAFSKQVGIDLERTFGWPVDMLVDLGKELGITALALLALEYRSAYVTALSEQKTEAAGEPQPDVSDKQAKRAGWLQ